MLMPSALCGAMLPDSMLTSGFLAFRDNRLSSLQGLSGLPSLRELRLDINHLTSLHELRALPSLTELSANSNHIRELDEDFAVNLMSSTTQSHRSAVPSPALTGKTDSRLGALAYTAVAGAGLQKLELYHNHISYVHPRALKGLASLTHLDLGRNQLEVLDGRSLESCPVLSTVILSQNQLREPPVPLRLPLLQELWLSGNRISGMGNWAVAPWSNQSLASISCVGNPRQEGRRRVNGRGKDITTESDAQDRGDYGVWLPSLQVLHLQDNALKSLEGHWSFAGVPGLRCLDASFNRLSTPHCFASSIWACSQLEEIRLHDNPVTTHPGYMDAITLCCPRVSRQKQK